MRNLYIVLFFCMAAVTAKADHLVGGELYYTYVGSVINNVPRYKITLRFFRNMQSNVPAISYETPVLGLYNGSSFLMTSIDLAYERVDTIRSSKLPGCVDASLQSIYEVGYFSATVDLQNIPGGYILSWIRCCRTNNITNMNLSDGGITLTAKIPSSDLIDTRFNNSAVFPLKDTVLICRNQSFALDFRATDVDNDSLSYQFTSPYHGASIDDPGPQPPPTITLQTLTFRPPTYSAAQPLGPGVTIDPSTGIISGTPAFTGNFIVTVKVTEWRNGKIINEHLKDIQIRVKDCSYAVAALKTEYSNCNSFEVYLQNEGQSSTNRTYNWDFGVAGELSDTSNKAQPTFKYADTGIYKVKLIVNKNTTCPDSANTTIKVYPGYKAAFIVDAACVNSVVQFTDASIATYGKVAHWMWNFDDPSNSGSSSADPSYTYTTPGVKDIRLISASDKGCIDTAFGTVQIFPKPSLNIITPDTTICNGDSLLIVAQATGSVAWLPATNIKNASSATPVVYPGSPITYIVSATENNCTSKDSIKINILARDAVSIGDQFAICSGERIRLEPLSNAANFIWTPSIGLSNALSKSPVAAPLSDITYIVTANPDGCATRDTVHLTVHPLPQVDAGSDVQINPNVSYQLLATGADRYIWSPAYGLSNTSIPDPTVSLPVRADSVLYTITGTSVYGCVSTDELSVVVIKEEGLYVPNAFTPNGDGKNDVLTPMIFGKYQLQEFVIYDRWGQSMFRTVKKGEGWDGRKKGSALPGGTFVWTLKAMNAAGLIIQHKGTVVLIR